MDLKSTINKTETLLNNVKTVKDQINQIVVRGGGITSKSLSELPNNINKMLKDNYKKTAIIKEAKRLGKIEAYSESTFTFNFNLNFKFEKIFFTLNAGGACGVCSNNNKEAYINPNLSASVLSFTKSSVTVILENTGSYGYESIYLTEIVAIE